MPQIIYKDITISILLDLLKVMMFGIFPLGNHFFKEHAGWGPPVISWLITFYNPIQII